MNTNNMTVHFLTISNVTLNLFGETRSKVTIIPFYGGGKGQSLQIIENPDGSVITTIIKTPENQQTQPEEEVINAAELENPPLPSKQDIDFGPNIRNIHTTALNIMKLQEAAKKNGNLNPSEEAIYQRNMDSLNLSAQNLAKLQDGDDDFSFETREGLSEWFERKKSNNKKDKDKKKEEDKKKKEEEKRKKEEEEEKKKEEEEKKRRAEEIKKTEEEKRKEEEKKKQKPKEEEEEEEEIVENEDDSITIGLPHDEASVAEAKPVGLAVAGEGGIASSKPVATAVVGPGGLAIARPVGTAIAGVAPDQALVPIYAEGYLGASKPKRYGTTKVSSSSSSELLSKIISKYHQH